jgi:hypothetical protein
VRYLPKKAINLKNPAFYIAGAARMLQGVASQKIIPPGTPREKRREGHSICAKLTTGEFKNFSRLCNNRNEVQQTTACRHAFCANCNAKFSRSAVDGNQSIAGSPWTKELKE